jgi:hypothetical protein
MTQLIRIGVKAVPVYAVEIDYEPTEYEIDVIACRCKNTGLDDGDYTCWTHHNHDDCTHQE